MGNVEWVALCQHAIYDEHGCLCALGIFHHAVLNALPGKIPQAALAFAIAGAPLQTVRCSLRVTGPSRREVTQASFDLQLGPFGTRESFVTLGDVEFDDYGTYQFGLRIGTSSPRSARLTVSAPPRAH
jgi:hypothetical protein